MFSRNDYRGKILRIDSATGRGVVGNPFFDAKNPNSVASRIYLTGVRNPWSHMQVPGQQRVAIWDVGADRRESLKILGKGEWGGWPCYEGNLRHSYIANQYCPASLVNQRSKRTVDYGHTGGNACIVGGVFLPSTWRSGLRNKLLYMDYGSGYIWTTSINSNGYTVGKAVLGRLPGNVRVVKGTRGRVWFLNFGDSGIWEVWDGTTKS